MRGAYTIKHSPKTETRSTGWQKRAACLDEDPELFFPVSYQKRGQVAAAKTVCANCEVFDLCAKRYLGETDGIFFATTPDERIELRVSRYNQKRREDRQAKRGRAS